MRRPNAVRGEGALSLRDRFGGHGASDPASTAAYSLPSLAVHGPVESLARARRSNCSASEASDVSKKAAAFPRTRLLTSEAFASESHSVLARW